MDDVDGAEANVQRFLDSLVDDDDAFSAAKAAARLVCSATIERCADVDALLREAFVPAFVVADGARARHADLAPLGSRIVSVGRALAVVAVPGVEVERHDEDGRRRCLFRISAAEPDELRAPDPWLTRVSRAPHAASLHFVLVYEGLSCDFVFESR